MMQTVTLIGGPMHGLLRPVNHDEVQKGYLAYSRTGFYRKDKTNSKLWVWSGANLDLKGR